MTLDEAKSVLLNGQCTKASLHESGCDTCSRTEQAMRVLVAEGARLAIDSCGVRLAIHGTPAAIARRVVP